MRTIFTNWKRLAVAMSVAIFAALLVFIYMSLPPGDFPEREIVKIEKNMYMSKAADLLEERGIIKSSLMYKAYIVLLSGHRQVKAGDYLFDKPESALRVAMRTAFGIQGLPKIKVTFYEGMTVADMAEALKKSIPEFDDASFLAKAKPYEGSLFPDTYFFLENTEPDEVLEVLRETFEEKMKDLERDIQAFGKPVKDVLAMASLVEKEVNNSKDRRMVAGILWRRIAIGMPLQVDASFHYILGKSSAELTRTDLAMDSPYNLYKNAGLPPTPINNPGLNAILDTINPTASKYLYFLSDKDGVTHFAETLAGHNANKAKYLR